MSTFGLLAAFGLLCILSTINNYLPVLIISILVVMAVAVEAKSLSEVLVLADNPPKTFPFGATQDHQELLVLYIARVPGSRGQLFHTG